MPSNDPTREELENTQQMPVIESGIASIKLALFTRLSRRFRLQETPDRVVPLAYCVMHSTFCEPITQPSLATFAGRNAQVIAAETWKVFADEELSAPVLFAYAAAMIAAGWETRNPFNAIASRLTEQATEHDQLVPNIVQMWGAEAIVTFFRLSQEFMTATFNA